MNPTQSRHRREVRHYLGRKSTDTRLRATARLAAGSIGAAYALVNVLDDDRQYTIAASGIEVPDMPRDETFCRSVLDTGRYVVVPDTRLDPRFAELPAVVGGLVRSYLGVPIRSRELSIIGTLCVLDPEPCEYSPEQIAKLLDYAQIVEDQLDLLRRSAEGQLEEQTTTATLVEALAAGEIVPWFQPIVDLRTGAVASYEALARWEHPNGSVVAPNRFLRRAEDSDIVMDVDLAVMQRALAVTRAWRRERPDLRVNLNLASSHLEIDGGLDAIRDRVAQGGVPPESITLELTETLKLSDFERAAESVRQLRADGFAVVLDDFGTGWSSLDWILRLPISGLKVDRSVGASLSSPVGGAVFRAMVAMADELSLLLTVEGIDDDAHLAMARDLGCHFGQGYLWSPPRPAAEIDADDVRRAHGALRAARSVRDGRRPGR